MSSNANYWWLEVCYKSLSVTQSDVELCSPSLWLDPRFRKSNLQWCLRLWWVSGVPTCGIGTMVSLLMSIVAQRSWEEGEFQKYILRCTVKGHIPTNYSGMQSMWGRGARWRGSMQEPCESWSPGGTIFCLLITIFVEVVMMVMPKTMAKAGILID